MKIIAVCELEEKEVDVKSNDETNAKEEVFNRVKRLFHMTSNKKQIWATLNSKITLMETKSKQLSLAEEQMKNIQSKLKTDIDQLKQKLSDNIKLLESSLKGSVM